MRAISKIFSIVLISSIFLISCGAVTPVVTTAIPTYSPNVEIIKPTITPEVTANASVTPIATVKPYANDYQLQPWIVNDPYYSTLIKEHDVGYIWDINSGQFRYDSIFKSIDLLKDPNLDWHDVAWQIVAEYPRGIPLSNMRTGQDLLAFLIEDALNNQGATPEDLFSSLEERIRSHTGCIGMDFDSASVASPSDGYLKIPNLFGDGKTALMFYANHSCESGAVYVLRDLDGVYLVTKIKDWQALSIPFAGYYLKIFNVGDTNGNHIPEVIIETYFGASGDPQHWSQKLDWYEWNQTKSNFKTDDIRVFSQGCDEGPCGGEWKFGTANVQGLRPLITDEFYFTEYDLYKSPDDACPVLDFQSVYLWNGSKYIRQSKKILQSTSTLPECQILWAYRALELENGRNDEAIKILAHAIEEWPLAMNVIFGPASRDYFALKLGVWYEERGESSQAIHTLQDLAEAPSNSSYDFASRLAASYLTARVNGGIIQACNEMEYLKIQSLNEIAPPPVMYISRDKTISEWGFGYTGWTHQVDSFCNQTGMMTSLASSVPFNNDMNTWLVGVGVTPKNIQQLDLGLPVNVWMVETTYKSFSAQYFAPTDKIVMEDVVRSKWWLFIKSFNGLIVTYLFDGNEEASNSIPSAQVLDLSQKEKSVLLKFNEYIVPFYIDSIGRLVKMPEDYFYDAYVTDGQIIAFEPDYFSDTTSVQAYTWNPKEQNFERRSLNYDFDKAQRQVEESVFRRRDYSSAIAQINIFLVQAPSEPVIEYSCSSSGCDDYPEWYRPYMRYLLALSYELSGQVDQARDTYYYLWKDYPANVFGLAAEHRLVLK